MEEYESYGNREWSEEEVEEEYENGYGNGDDGNNKQQGWEGKELGHNRRGGVNRGCDGIGFEIGV